MSEELTIFRQNRLAYLRQKYNADCARLYSNLAVQIANIQKARLAVRNKQQLLNNAVNQYYKDINTLTVIFNGWNALRRLVQLAPDYSCQLVQIVNVVL